jgi:hypothetical protein
VAEKRIVSRFRRTFCRVFGHSPSWFFPRCVRCKATWRDDMRIEHPTFTGLTCFTLGFGLMFLLSQLLVRLSQ